MTETKMMYHYQHGLVETSPDPSSINRMIYKTADQVTYSIHGSCKAFSSDKYPILISLEQAEKQGLIKQEEDTSYQGLQVKYSDLFGVYGISIRRYRSKMEFLKASEGLYTFVSFVDEKLNECPPPKEAVFEWAEVSQG